LAKYFLPICEVVENANDKPWITEEFHRVTRHRHIGYAFTYGQFDNYRCYRNEAIRLAKQLSNYANARWWRSV